MLRQREKLLLFNQKYWGNFKRKEWLVNGDRNSRFFHHQANTKRKKKLVCKIKDECGIWIDNPQIIAETFVHAYSTRFRTTGDSSNVLIDPPLRAKLSDEDILALIKTPDMIEVKAALFSSLGLDSLKSTGKY